VRLSWRPIAEHTIACDSETGGQRKNYWELGRIIRGRVGILRRAGAR
jgi:hypothetical protein